MKRVFVDSDVFLDVLFNRAQFADDSAKVFDLAILGKVQIYTTSICISNMHYLLSKKMGSKIARALLIELKPLFTVLNTSDQAIVNALHSKFRDVEDAFQYFSALEHNMDLIVTRNIADYKKAALPVLTPTEYLATL